MKSQVKLSVIIPTFKRQQLLARAIGSALQDSSGETEVIVVPNGPDNTWLAVADVFRSDHRIRFFPVDIAHACRARNYGLEVARGEFIRFLDDDDILYPDSAARQLQELIESDADVCSGAIAWIDEIGRKLGTRPQPISEDFVASVLGPARATFTHAHVFRRSVLETVKWSEDLAVGQDVDFIIRLCCSAELSWRRVDYEVGAWTHHGGERIYRGRDPGALALRNQAAMLLNAADSLKAQGRLSTERRRAIADGLWGCFQKGYMREPAFWLQVASAADKLAKARHPPSAIYRLPLIGKLDPRIVETMLVPARAAVACLRAAKRKAW